MGGSGIVYEQIHCKYSFKKKMDKIEKKLDKSRLWLSDKTLASIITSSEYLMLQKLYGCSDLDLTSIKS